MRHTAVVIAGFAIVLAGCGDAVSANGGAAVKKAEAKKTKPMAEQSSPAAAGLGPQGDETGLAGKKFTFPVHGLKKSDVHDNYAEKRDGDKPHQAIDIMAPLDTPVFAFEDGTVKKFFDSRFGGHTIYQFDPTSNFVYYYAHLDHRAETLKEGDFVHRGDVIGYVGYSGNAQPNAPHLHFEIGQLGPEKQWWKSTPINPYPYLVTSEFR